MNWSCLLHTPGSRIARQIWRRRRKPGPPKRRKFLLETLEPRLLLSADPTILLTPDLDPTSSPNEPVILNGISDAVAMPVQQGDDMGAQATAPLLTLDVDDSGRPDALTDGILIARYMQGITGEALTDRAVDLVNGRRTNPNDIIAFLDQARITAPFMLDVDDNDVTDALRDGILIVRFLFGFTGQALIDGAVDLGGNRTSAVEISAFLQGFLPGVNTAPVASDDSYNAIGNTLLEVGVPASGGSAVMLAGSLFDNDADQPGDTFMLDSFDATSTQGGEVSVNADGTFTYLPAPGFTGGIDTFNYTIRDTGGLTDTAAVSIDVTEMVWYVDNTASPGGDGRATSSFNSLAALNGVGGAGDPDNPGDVIFVFEGNGPYTGGIELENNQQLIGQGVDLVVGGIVLLTNQPQSGQGAGLAVAAAFGPKPTLTNSDGDGITLASGNTVRGLGVGNTSGAGIRGNGNVGTFTLDYVSITGSGAAVDIANGGLLNVTLDSVSSTDAIGAAINLDGVGGSYTVSNPGFGVDTFIAGANTGISIKNALDGATFSFGETVVENSGAGFDLDSNPTAAITFDSADVTTTGGAGVFGNNTGTVNIGGTNNTINATGGPAVDVSDTNLSENGWTFLDLTSINSSESGIELNGVTGDFVANGGSISDAAGVAFDIDSGSSNIIYAGNINNSIDRALEVTGRSGGTVSFNGRIDDVGEGIRLDSNTGATINFAGGLNLDTTTNDAFTVTGSGIVSVTGDTNTINTTTGTAVNFQDTTIGASGLTFQNISAGTETGGPVNGILLDSTGNGGLTVTGDGSGMANGSGGTIQNTTGHAISLNNTGSVFITGLDIIDIGTTPDDNAIVMVDTSGFSFRDGSVSGASGGGIRSVNLDELSVVNVDFSNNFGNAIDVFIDTGNANLDISNSFFRVDPTPDPFPTDLPFAINVRSAGDAYVRAMVGNNAAIDYTWDGNFISQGESFLEVEANGNNFGGELFGLGFDASEGGEITINVDGNTFSNPNASHSVIIGAFDGTVSGNVTNNAGYGDVNIGVGDFGFGVVNVSTNSLNGSVDGSVFGNGAAHFTTNMNIVDEIRLASSDDGVATAAVAGNEANTISVQNFAGPKDKAIFELEMGGSDSGDPAEGLALNNPLATTTRVEGKISNVPNGTIVTPDPNKLLDVFHATQGKFVLGLPDGSEEEVTLTGLTVVTRDREAVVDMDGNEEVKLEMVQLVLTGVNQAVGEVRARVIPSQPSLGVIRETMNNIPGELELPADSSFDLFVNIEIPGLGMILHNMDPLTLQALISDIPPAPGEQYENTDPVNLYDEAGNPTGIVLLEEIHIPNPERDFGDAPDPTYPTLLTSNGASHVIAGPFLGTSVDPDPDGQPSALADGDDTDGIDDEDGVVFMSPLSVGETATLEVTASEPGILNGWIDFDNDGGWDFFEQIFFDQAFTFEQPLVAGVNNLSFLVPALATPTDQTFARFRFSSAGGLFFKGPAPDGEVEDYEVEIGGPIANFEVVLEPETGSTGSGKGFITINETTRVVTWFVFGSDLSSRATAGHLHGGLGENGDTVDFGFNNEVDPIGFSFSGESSAPPGLINDILIGDATVNVHTENLTGGEIIGQVTGVDALLGIDDVSVVEGDAGTTTSVTLTMTLTNAVDTPVTVVFATADGTATTADSDYTSTNGVVTFAPGEVAKEVTVEVNGDTFVELDETFSVNVSVASTGGAVVGLDDIIGGSGGRGKVIIINDDEQVEEVLGYSVVLDGAQTGSQGVGTGFFTIVPASHLMTYSITGQGLSGPPTAGHLHGPSGESGYIFDLGTNNASTPGDFIYSGQSIIAAPVFIDIFNGNASVNIHTGYYQDVEIEGQITSDTPPPSFATFLPPPLGATSDPGGLQTVSSLGPLTNPEWLGQADMGGSTRGVVDATATVEVSIFTPGEIVSTERSEVSVAEASFADGLTNLAALREDPRFEGIDGSGMTAVIVDTGIDVDHPFFGPDLDNDGVADRIVYQYDFADDDADASDRAGHGSVVSSIIGSQDDTYRGVAPGADLIALKVFEDEGPGNFSYLEEALQWVVENAVTYDIDVVNMSVADGNNWDESTSLYGLGDELAALADLDVIVVTASGNEFYGFDSVMGVVYPAADPNTLAVGAVWSGDFGGPWQFSSGAVDSSTGADRIASFTQRDDELLDIMAPGARFTGAGTNGGTLAMQGTSQASAYLSGTALLAQQVAEEEMGRRLTVEEFGEVLVASAELINDGDDEQDNVVNTGLDFLRVDVLGMAESIVALGEGESESETLEGGNGVRAASTGAGNDFRRRNWDRDEDGDRKEVHRRLFKRHGEHTSWYHQYDRNGDDRHHLNKHRDTGRLIEWLKGDDNKEGQNWPVHWKIGYFHRPSTWLSQFLLDGAEVDGGENPNHDIEVVIQGEDSRTSI